MKMNLIINFGIILALALPLIYASPMNKFRRRSEIITYSRIGPCSRYDLCLETVKSEVHHENEILESEYLTLANCSSKSTSFQLRGEYRWFYLPTRTTLFRPKLGLGTSIINWRDHLNLQDRQNTDGMYFLVTNNGRDVLYYDESLKKFSISPKSFVYSSNLFSIPKDKMFCFEFK